MQVDDDDFSGDLGDSVNIGGSDNLPIQSSDPDTHSLASEASFQLLGPGFDQQPGYGHQPGPSGVPGTLGIKPPATPAKTTTPASPPTAAAGVGQGLGLGGGASNFSSPHRQPDDHQDGGLGLYVNQGAAAEESSSEEKGSSDEEKTAEASSTEEEMASTTTELTFSGFCGEDPLNFLKDMEIRLWS